MNQIKIVIKNFKYEEMSWHVSLLKYLLLNVSVINSDLNLIS